MKTFRQFRTATVTSVFLLAIMAAGCSKKTPIPPPPPPPSQTTSSNSSSSSTRATVAEFVVEPSTVERGQSAVIRWSVTGGSDVAIDRGIGTVPATGTRRIVPTETTTYTLTANGAGGPVTATATVTVTGPAPPPAPTVDTSRNRRGGTLESRIQSDLQDALFGYDSVNIDENTRATLTSDAAAIKQIFADFPNATINVEGHCDERGSAEYNLGLGDRRASSARDFLAQLGVPADRLKTISYGKERPVCTESDEGCWQRNRRAHFSTGQ